MNHTEEISNYYNGADSDNTNSVFILLIYKSNVLFQVLVSILRSKGDL